MPTLKETVETYLKAPRSPYTQTSYRHVLVDLAVAIGPERDIRLIRYDDLADYIIRLQRERGLRPTSTKQYLQIIRTFFNHCVKQGILEHSPADGLVMRRAPRAPGTRAVPPDELADMIASARSRPRDYTVLLFLADTGCRVGGLVSLTLDHLDLNENSALLLEKGSRWHKVFFGHQTADALRDWLEKRPKVTHGYVFTTRDGRPLTRSAVTELVMAAARRSGASRAWRPHAIRHAVGHALANAGVPVSIVQRKLGHANPNITVSFYYPDDEEAVREASRQHSLAAARPPRKPERPKEKVLRFSDYVS